MVGVGASDFLILDGGIGLTLQMDHPLDAGILDIVENFAFSSGPGERNFDLKGKRKGKVTIRGLSRDGLLKIPLLEVEVKEKLPLKIAFQFVTDNSLNSPNQWNQASGFMTQLKFNTNSIFERQANLVFDVTREKDVQVNTSLRDIIGKQDRQDLAFTRSLRAPYHEWFKLTGEGDPLAAINVFFIARSFLQRDNVFPPLIFGMDGNLLVEDDPFRRIEQLERELARFIAETLGVNRTQGRRHAEYLMSPSTDVTARKLPKEHANMLNPTF